MLFFFFFLQHFQHKTTCAPDGQVRGYKRGPPPHILDFELPHQPSTVKTHLQYRGSTSSPTTPQTRLITHPSVTCNSAIRVLTQEVMEPPPDQPGQTQKRTGGAIPQVPKPVSFQEMEGGEHRSTLWWHQSSFMVCWGGSISAVDRKGLEERIQKASSVCEGEVPQVLTSYSCQTNTAPSGPHWRTSCIVPVPYTTTGQ